MTSPPCFNIPNQPPALLLWHHSRPLPASGKLPACTLLHQEPQEMSLGERWSLIKNKWMGCPRDRANEDWEKEREKSRSRCPEVEDRQERRREGKTRYKIWTHYCVGFSTVMNQGNQNQLQRGVLVNENGNADQLADHLKPSLYPFLQWPVGTEPTNIVQTHSQTQFARERVCAQR